MLLELAVQLEGTSMLDARVSYVRNPAHNGPRHDYLHS
jgi:hypothetical protein